MSIEDLNGLIDSSTRASKPLGDLTIKPLAEGPRTNKSAPFGVADSSSLNGGYRRVGSSFLRTI
jgi:hypothetical protein